MKQLPKTASAVVIGGGIVGCSVAYHLAKLGWHDVVLLERKKLTCGTTWHSAGQIGYLRPTLSLSRLAAYSGELYRSLESETEQAVGYINCGSFYVATTPERLEEIRRAGSMGRSFGVETTEVAAADISSAWPIAHTDDILGGLYIPADSRINPVDTTNALAKGARRHGAQIFEDIAVRSIESDGRRVRAVNTDGGRIECDYIVNCGGIWGRSIGEMAGVDVPLQAAEHYYFISEEMPELKSTTPILRDPDRGTYMREDAGKLLFGIFELEAKPWAVDGIPEDFAFDPIPEDWDHCEPLFEAAMHRIPKMANTGIRLLFCGPESFTPDEMFHIGPAATLDNFYVACGFNSLGAQSAGGVGKIVAEWMDVGTPPIDVSDFDIRRCQPGAASPLFLVDRTVETLGFLYAMHWPYRQHERAREARRTPLHAENMADTAVFGEECGWEIADWFAEQKDPTDYEYAYGQQPWFSASEREAGYLREAVGLIDESHHSKIRVAGPEAETWLSGLVASRLPDQPISVKNGIFLNSQGGIELCATIVRDTEGFLLITTAECQVRALEWLRQNVDQAAVTVIDMTSAYALLTISGAKASSHVGQAIGVTGDTSRCWLGYAPATLVKRPRSPYDTWQAIITTEFAGAAYKFLTAETQGSRLRRVGRRAWQAAHFAAGIAKWGVDFGSADDPAFAGLGNEVERSRDCWKGYDALDNDARQRSRTNGSRLVCLGIDEGFAYGGEPVIHNNDVVGHVTSGCYSFSDNACVTFACLNEPEIAGQSEALTVEVAGQQRTARLRPMAGMICED